ncbi:vomeronasal type-2 receptor 1-like [Spea bombifrons]|uniref:vomeronasal type-2 receptor 1-like n=1 Tax=Spea bombifrons TaxID=233779 RepID=UPI00234B9AC6|nr:vomeronasal type-2 receptor 1-like [Spea bombifrons]
MDPSEIGQKMSACEACIESLDHHMYQFAQALQTLLARTDPSRGPPPAPTATAVAVPPLADPSLHNLRLPPPPRYGGWFKWPKNLQDSQLENYRSPTPRYYRYLLAFIFTVNEINRDPFILRNLTLGYHALDSCGDVNKAIENVLRILSGPSRTVPNYSCRSHGKLAGVIGDLSSETSLHIANILSLYDYPQISYGATDPLLTNKQLYRSFFQTLPSDRVQFDAIVKLLKHFGWNWVGILASDDDVGERQTLELKNLGERHGVCFEFTLKMPPPHPQDRIKVIERQKVILKKATSKIIILTGTVYGEGLYLYLKEYPIFQTRTYIMPASWNLILHMDKSHQFPFDGGLAFARPTCYHQQLQSFLENISPSNRPNDLLLEYIRLFYFRCLTSDSRWNKFMARIGNTSLINCSRTDTITRLDTQYYVTKTFQTTCHVLQSVFAMIWPLHLLLFYISEKLKRNDKTLYKTNYRSPVEVALYHCSAQLALRMVIFDLCTDCLPIETHFMKLLRHSACADVASGGSLELCSELFSITVGDGCLWAGFYTPVSNGCS